LSGVLDILRLLGFDFFLLLLQLRIVRDRLPNSVQVVDNLPVQLFKGNRAKQVVVATPDVEDKPTLQSVRSVEVERRPSVGFRFVLFIFVRFIFFVLQVLDVALFVSGRSRASFFLWVLGFDYVLATLLLFINLNFAA